MTKPSKSLEPLTGSASEAQLRDFRRLSGVGNGMTEDWHPEGTKPVQEVTGYSYIAAVDAKAEMMADQALQAALTGLADYGKALAVIRKALSHKDRDALKLLQQALDAVEKADTDLRNNADVLGEVDRALRKTIMAMESAGFVEVEALVPGAEELFEQSLQAAFVGLNDCEALMAKLLKKLPKGETAAAKIIERAVDDIREARTLARDVDHVLFDVDRELIK